MADDENKLDKKMSTARIVKPRAPKTVSGKRLFGKTPEPLKVSLSVAVRFGEAEDDRVVLMDDRELVMVGSVFRYRDKISKFMVTGLLRAAMLQPKVATALFPKLMRRAKK